MSKQIPHMFVTIIKKKLYSLIIMVAFLCLIGVHPSSTFAAADLESGISQLSQQISKNMTESGKKAIAVVEFSDLDGNITAFGQFLAEELITQLFMISPGQFEVVERRQLMKVLSEQRLTMSGLLDAKAMESVGKILGIEAIVTGSVANLGSVVKVNARLIGVDTARVFAVAATKIPNTDIVKDLLGKEAAPVQFYTEPSSTTASQQPVQRVRTSRKSKPQDFGNFRIETESLKVMADGGIMVALSYINLTDKEFEITMDYPPKESAFAVDNAGNEYVLLKSSGMARRGEDPNYDIRHPGATSWHSSFLLTPPGKKVRASFLFKSNNKSEDDESIEGNPPETFTITIGHYARPTKDFNPKKKLKGAFSFSATISNVKPD